MAAALISREFRCARRGILPWLGFIVLCHAHATPLPSPRFNNDGGWQSRPLLLTLTLEVPVDGSIIWYATNGPPTDSSNRIRYTTPLPIDSSRVIRAYAEAPGLASSAVVAHTFLFVNDILGQTNRPTNWPSTWGSNRVDYGLGLSSIADPSKRRRIEQAFWSLPTVALTVALPDLFDSSTGIYANASQDGRAWERPATFEMFFQNGTRVGVDAGLRIRGGFSRDAANPKHSFRLYFRSSYGSGSFQFPATVEPFGEFGRTAPAAVRAGAGALIPSP